MKVKELAENGMIKGKVIHRIQTNETKCKEMGTKLAGGDGNVLKLDCSNGSTTL